MTKFTLLAAGSFLSFVALTNHTLASTLATELFNYDTATTFPLANGGAGFNSAYDNTAVGAPGGTRAFTSGSLDYSDPAFPTETGNKATMTGGGANAVSGRTFSPVTSGTLYVSFLIDKTTLTNRTLNLALFGNVTSVATALSERVSIGQFGPNATAPGATDTNGNFGFLVGAAVVPGGAGITTVPFNQNQVYLVVGKLELNMTGTGTDDRFTLYINPSVASEPVTFAAQYTGAMTENVAGFRLFAGSGTAVTPAVGDFDEIRFGTTYQDVTVVPEPGVLVSLVGGMGLLVGLRRRRAQ